jgi:hypothetical protein
MLPVLCSQTFAATRHVGCRLDKRVQRTLEYRMCSFSSPAKKLCGLTLRETGWSKEINVAVVIFEVAAGARLRVLWVLGEVLVSG